MSLGPREDGIRRDGLQDVAVRAIGVLHRHKDALQEALPIGSVPSVIREELRALALTPAHVLEMLKDPSYRQSLSTVLGLQQLAKSDLSLQELRRELIHSRTSEGGRFLLACKLFFSTPETTSLGAVLLKAALYPALSEGEDLESLRQVTSLMSRQLAAPLPGSESCEHPGFENWRRIASKLLFWSYGLSPISVSLDAYMKAAQLGDKCFGSLEDPRDLSQAVRVLQEFIPKRSDDAATLYSQPVPVQLRDGIGYEGLAVVLREFPIQEQLVPWMIDMLAQVKRGFQDCASRCANYRQEQTDKPWQSVGFFQEKQDSVKGIFNYTVDAFADVCGFFAIAVDCACKGRTEDSEDLLRTELQDQLGPNVADTIKDFCAVIRETGFNFPCTTRLAEALDELLNERLKLPLDIEAEESDCPGNASVYQGCMLRAFRKHIGVGDLESAVNMRRLFPLAGYTGTLRDTIDQYIDEHQDIMLAGVIAACRLLTKSRHLGPDATPAVDNLVKGLYYFIRPELMGPVHVKLAAEALSGVVRLLVASTMEEEATGMTTHWGCQKAGLVLQRIRCSPELGKQVVSKALAAEGRGLVPTIARFIVRFNENEHYGRDAGAVEALYDACSDFREMLPAPRTRDLSTAELMKEHVIVALRTWQGGLDGDAPVDRLDLNRMEPFVAGLDTSSSPAGDLESNAAQMERSVVRDAHGSILLLQWERQLTESDGSLVKGEYPMHARHLLNEARAMLLIADSADLIPASFRATFAGLFVGLLRGWNDLVDRDLRQMADCASQMLQCQKSPLLCSDRKICDDAGRLFAQVATQHAVKFVASRGDLRAHESIKELLNHWGLGASN